MSGTRFDSRRLHSNHGESSQDSATGNDRCPHGDQPRGFTVQERLGRFHLYSRSNGKKVYRGSFASLQEAEINGRRIALGFRHHPAEKVDVESFSNDVHDAQVRIDLACGRERPGGYVYAVQSCGLIKIGRCEEPGLRLRGLQLQSAAPLVLLGLVHGAHLERGWHNDLAESRAHGEWFRIDEPPFFLTAPGARCMACDGAVLPSQSSTEANLALVDEHGRPVDKRETR